MRRPTLIAMVVAALVMLGMVTGAGAVVYLMGPPTTFNSRATDNQYAIPE